MTDIARFRVDRAFDDASRGAFVLMGDVVEGQPRTGMTAEGPSFSEPIHAVEPADSGVRLVFPYAQLAERDRWRSIDWSGITLSIPAAPILHPCPCCGFRALTDEERGGFEICGVCGWEDDLVQYHDPGYRGGANSESLHEARAAFLAAHPHLAPIVHG